MGCFFLHFLSLFYYLEVFCYFLFILEGEGGTSYLFIYFINFTFKNWRQAWVYLFIYFCYILLFIFFCHIFYLLKWGGWHEFYFSHFLLFFVLCVKLLLSFFTLARGRGCEFIFHF